MVKFGSPLGPFVSQLKMKLRYRTTNGSRITISLELLSEVEYLFNLELLLEAELLLNVELVI